MRRKTSLRRRLDVLTTAEEFELIAQCSAPPRHFADEQDRREAWQQHRDRLLASCRAGSRPSAWWVYDRAPAERPQVRIEHTVIDGRRCSIAVTEHEVSALVRCGLATPEDVDQLRHELAFYASCPELCRLSDDDRTRLHAVVERYEAETRAPLSCFGLADEDAALDAIAARAHKNGAVGRSVGR